MENRWNWDKTRTVTLSTIRWKLPDYDNFQVQVADDQIVVTAMDKRDGIRYVIDRFDPAKFRFN